MEPNNFTAIALVIIVLFVLGLVFFGTEEGSFQEVSASLENEVHSISVN